MYQYSNCNYQTLGLIIQQVSGTELRGVHGRARIRAAGDESHVHLERSGDFKPGSRPGTSTWFGHPQPFDEPLPRGSVPQGFIISTAQDLAHYLGAQLNGGRYGNATVLSSAGMAELHHGTARIGDSDVYYAMGWNAGTVDGQKAVWHEGDTFGFQSFLLVLTDAHWGVALMSNKSDIPANSRFEEIAFGVASLVSGRRSENRTRSRRDARIRRICRHRRSAVVRHGADDRVVASMAPRPGDAATQRGGQLVARRAAVDAESVVGRGRFRCVAGHVRVDPVR